MAIMATEQKPPIELGGQTRTGKKRARRRGDGPVAAGFLAPSLGGFAIFTLIPILASFVVAFTVWPLGGDPTFVGFANFIKLLTADPNFLQSLGNTLVFVVAYVPLNIVLALSLATWISPRIRGQNGYRVLLFIPVVTPMVANAAVWQLMLVPNGVIDGVWQTVFGAHAPNFLGSSTFAMTSVVLMSLWQGFGYNLLVFVSALEAVPENLLEAASLDGASQAVLPDQDPAHLAGHLLRRDDDRDHVVPGLRPAVRSHGGRAGQQHLDPRDVPVPDGLPVPQSRIRVGDRRHPVPGNSRG
jgi:ABC-type spermidine/putrescine transport system permease subunit I